MMGVYGMILKTDQESVLDFEVERGTNPINIFDLRTILNFFKKGSWERIYLLLLYTCGLRPSEPLHLTWHNFSEDGLLIFRPRKQKLLSKGTIRPRKIRIPPKTWEEIKEYRDNGFFPNGVIFNVKRQTFRTKMSKTYRKKLGGIWNKKSENLKQGKIPQFYHYTTSSFRCTTATTIYYLYLREYENQPDMALHLTSRWMGHGKGLGAGNVTAYYYLKKLNKLGLDTVPKEVLSGLDLFDYVIYGECRQSKIKEFVSERNSLLMEHG